jgi:spoIIIJ-associated protein
MAQVTVDAGSLEDALRDLVARLAGVAPGAVELSLRVEGSSLATLGPVTVTATLAAPDDDEDDEFEDEPAAAVTPDEDGEVDEDEQDEVDEVDEDEQDEDDEDEPAAVREVDEDEGDEDDERGGGGDDERGGGRDDERGDGEARGRDRDREDDDEEALSPEDLDAEADAAADFLEGLLDAMDLPGDLQIRVHDDHAEIEIVNVGSGRLIGRRGQTLESIQELLRSALQRRFERRSRVLIDVEEYRARRLEKVIDKAEAVIEEVLESGEAQRLEPMDVHERKAVHHLVASYEGVTSSSRGREPTRRVVIEPS